MQPLTKTETEVKKDKQLKANNPPSMLSIILTLLFVLFIFSFMASDYITLNNKIDSKIITVAHKMDSLNSYVITKSENFDKNYQIQQDQLAKAKLLGQ